MQQNTDGCGDGAVASKSVLQQLATLRLDDFAQDDHQRDVNDGENEENIHRPNETQDQRPLARMRLAAGWRWKSSKAGTQSSRRFAASPGWADVAYSNQISIS